MCVCVCSSNGFVFSHLCYRYLHDLCECVCVVVGYCSSHFNSSRIVIVSVSFDVQFLSGLSYNKYHLTSYICHFNVDTIECMRSVAPCSIKCTIVGCCWYSRCMKPKTLRNSFKLTFKLHFIVLLSTSSSLPFPFQCS